MNTRTLTLSAQITQQQHGLRLDQALVQLFPDYSRSKLQEWIAQQNVLVDGKALRAKDKVRVNQQIQIIAELLSQGDWQPQAIPLSIIYEDEDLLVINKPVGLVVHPGAGNPESTLVNALLHYAPELAQLPRAGIIHRLDKDTSGLLIVARSMAAHTHLVAELQNRTIKREYAAIVNGIILTSGTVDAPIGRHPTQRTRMAVNEAGKHAVTHYQVIKRFKAHTYLNILLETGRTHQIRVHMSYIGHAIVGDKTYSRLMIPKNSNEELRKILKAFPRQALHAQRLTLIHPRTHEEMMWEAPMPEDMQCLLQALQENQ